MRIVLSLDGYLDRHLYTALAEAGAKRRVQRVRELARLGLHAERLEDTAMIGLYAQPMSIEGHLNWTRVDIRLRAGPDDDLIAQLIAVGKGRQAARLRTLVNKGLAREARLTITQTPHGPPENCISEKQLVRPSAIPDDLVQMLRDM